MVHSPFNGSQEQSLLETANFIVSNPDGFIDNVVSWSQSFINGGISNTTYAEIIDRAGVSIQTGTSGDQIITQTNEAVDNLQNQQLIALGEATSQRAEENIRQDQSIAELWADSVRQAESIAEINARVSGQLTDLGQAVGQDDFLGSLQSTLGGVGIGALAVGALVLFLFIKGKI